MAVASKPISGGLTKLPSDAVSFLDTWFTTSDSISSAPFILESLTEEHTNLLRRNTRLEARLAREAARACEQSEKALAALSSLAERVGRTKDDAEAASAESTPLVCRLAELAHEVARVEKVRIYVQALLQLESSVIDMEEHIAEANRARSGKLDRLVPAVEAFKNTTTLAADFARTHPQWWRLLLAVDLRLDQGLAGIRPALDQIYRASLSSVNWPPPLLPGSEATDEDGTLLHFDGSEGNEFRSSFGTLSLLQVVQSAREVRSRSGGGSVLESTGGSGLESDPLWTFQALVEPIAKQAEPHLSKWVDQPEFAFALCLKVAQDHVGLADAGLQLLLEKAGLVGVSAREEWVKAVAGALASAHLRERGLPFLMQKLEEDREAYAVLWLLTVDQALVFDKQMQKLVAGSSGIRLGLTEPGYPATVGVFAERDAWLRTWSRLELEDAQRKAKAILVKDSGWEIVHTKGENGDDWSEEANDVGPSGSEFRPPMNAEGVVGLLQATIERCRTLPRADHRLAFVEAVTLPLLARYEEKVKDKCQEIQGLTSLAHDADMVRIAAGLNGLHFIEQQMHDWSDELFFIELQAAATTRTRTSGAPVGDGWDLDVGTSAAGGSERGAGEGGETGSVFDEEVRRAQELQEEWLGKLVSAMVRQFESRTEEYQRNKKRWSEDSHPSSLRDGSQDIPSTSATPRLSGETSRRPSRSDTAHTPSPEDKAAAKRKRRVTFNLDNLPDRGAGGVENRVSGNSSAEPSPQPGGIPLVVDVSPTLVDALSAFRSQLLALHVALDEELFTKLWRRVAAAIDQLLLDKVVLGSSHFAKTGTAQLQADLEALASVFRPFTGRPLAHFRLLSDALTLLNLPGHAARSLQGALTGQSKETSAVEELKGHGIRRLSAAQAESILQHR
ncbi:ER to golgi transport protein [Klebsormidium nitens]|uniref:ER to golgi transport protein n=1 Tax=Klebsormidium nitens TaxID=105231 RepID=A0A1Y1HJE7_KLENI|nr:ER to golgi transport protein [Klebsormidium nitens]|eukprot:GAQ78664.1 ER to golgi transport protein [Klebsormidium nitens]